jgi:hypothetical protein
MKKLILAAAAFGLVSGSALAQDAPPPPKPPTPQDAVNPDAPPPPPMGGPRAMGPHGPRPIPDKAAHFRVEDKGFKVDVKCAEDDSTTQCAEVVLKLLDRVGPPKK